MPREPPCPSCQTWPPPSPSKFVECLLGELGKSVGLNPFGWLFTFLIMAAALGTGLQRLTFETDNETLFVPNGAKGLEERNLVERHFPLDYSSEFSRGHESRYGAQISLIIEAVRPDRDGIMSSTRLFDLAKEIDLQIKEVIVRDGSESFDFVKVCAHTSSSEGFGCQGNDFLKLASVFDYVRKGVTNVTYPSFTHQTGNSRYFLPLNFGNVTTVKNSQNETIVADATVLRMAYILDDTKPKTSVWEATVLKYVNDKDWSKDFRVFAVSSKSLETALARNIESAVPYIPYAVAFVAFFAVLNSFRLTSWKQSKPTVAIFGIVNTAIAVAAGWGFLMYLGTHKWQAINLAGAFLLLGVGMDDAFVMLSSWSRKFKPDLSLKQVAKEAYQEAAVSITITSFTNIGSFLIGALMPGFGTVRIFCMYTAVGLVAVYLWTLTFYGAVLVKASELSLSSNRLSQMLGINSGIVKTDRDSGKGPMAWIFEDVLPSLLSKAHVKAVVIVCFVVYIGFTIAFLNQMKEGLQQGRIAKYDSVTSKYYAAEDRHFRKLPYRIQVIFTDSGLDYSNETVQAEIQDFLSQVRKHRLMSNNTDLTESWLDHYRQSRYYSTESKEDFALGLQRFLNVVRKTPLPSNVEFIDGQIVASRFVLQSDDVLDAVDEVELLRDLRAIADKSTFNVTLYHPYFPFFDQFAQVKHSTIECAIYGCLAVVVITGLLIPDLFVLAIILLAILSIEAGVAGFMVLFGVYLDVISMITLIMCIGFSVDFCAHISHHFSASRIEDIDARLKDSLSAYGPPILQGGLSTMLGVTPLFFISSYILHTFATLMYLVVILGVLHGLVVLPVFLTIAAKMKRVVCRLFRNQTTHNHQA